MTEEARPIQQKSVVAGLLDDVWEEAGKIAVLRAKLKKRKISSQEQGIFTTGADRILGLADEIDSLLGNVGSTRRRSVTETSEVEEKSLAQEISEMRAELIV